MNRISVAVSVAQVRVGSEMMALSRAVTESSGMSTQGLQVFLVQFMVRDACSQHPCLGGEQKRRAPLAPAASELAWSCCW
jgi:hypothetical protein